MLSQKASNTAFVVIPVKTGIQEFQHITQTLDTRLRGYDDILRIHHNRSGVFFCMKYDCRLPKSGYIL